MHSEALNERLQKIQTSATGRWSEILTGAGISDDFLRKKDARVRCVEVQIALRSTRKSLMVTGFVVAVAMVTG